MKFSRREDIAAPPEAVFAALGDFAAFERQARQSGFEVARKGAPADPDGLAWEARGLLRGRERLIALRMAEWRPHEGLCIALESGGLTGALTVVLQPLAPGRTRAQVGLELRALTVSARVALHAARLAKPRLDQSFASRIAAFARDTEARNAAAASPAASRPEG